MFKVLGKVAKLRKATQSIAKFIDDIEQGVEELKAENRAIDIKVQELAEEKQSKLEEGLEAVRLVNKLRLLIED